MSDWLNPSGWGSFVDFWATAFSPRLDRPFVADALRASVTTVSLAVLGTLLALVIGAFLAPVMARAGWSDRRRGRTWARLLGGSAQGTSVAMRGVHELVWGLVLTQIFGLDPLVAVLAIGIPFGGVTAKVFAEHLDAADPAPGQSLRAAGAGRRLALLVGQLPAARPDLLSYAFYRLECAFRSAAVLGLLGLGGLGSELMLSFQSLHFDEVWTFIWALVIIGGLADRWSSWVRRRAESDIVRDGSDPVLRLSWAALVGLGIASWWSVAPNLGRLWSPRSQDLAADLAQRAWPPVLPDGGWSELAVSSWRTVLVAAGAIAIAAVGGLIASFRTDPLSRLLLLIARAVPPPVWAFVVVLILLPGTLPGAVALGFYNLGVLGRLQAEVVEHHDRRPSRLLRAAGARRVAAFAAGTLPVVWPRFRSLTAYRWEVAIRETVTVGVAGATGLGRDLSQQLAARAFNQAFATILALVAVTILADRLVARRAVKSASSVGA